MSHSHLSLQHLIRQAEDFGTRKEQRDNRPAWVMEFVDELADSFEPLHDVGRVGFECEWTDAGWVVGLYLGSTEIIGGPSDGRLTPPSFQFDLKPLIGSFASIDSFRMHALHEPTFGEEQYSHAYIEIQGMVEQQEQIVLRVFNTPPESAGPAFHQYADGSFVTA